jgi:hypothetical protein
MTWNRLASVLTGATAAVHLGLAVTGLGAAPLPSLILVAMAAWCLVCAKHLWESASARTCLLAAGGGLAMIVLHVGMMSAPQPAMAHHHHHHMEASSSSFSAMDVAMATGIVAEVVLLAGFALAVRRNLIRG